MIILSYNDIVIYKISTELIIFMSIFIVEDDKSLRNLYERVIKLAGFHISGTAKNGMEAVELYKTFQNKPEIILMDHRMPLKNGLETMKEIIQYDNSAKVIFTSADHVIEKEARREGAIDFLHKPFSNSYLIEKINMIITITQY